MSNTLIEQATKRFGEAEVYRVQSESKPVFFENNRLKELIHRETSGVALRVIKNGRLGFSSTTNPNLEPDLLNKVDELSNFGSIAEFEFPNDYPDLNVYMFDESIQCVLDDHLIDTGNNMMDHVRSKWPDALCDIRIGRGWKSVDIQNSSGLHKTFKNSSFYIYFGVQLIRGTDMLNVWDGHTSNKIFDNEQKQKILQTLLTTLDRSQKIVKAPTGDIPVIFTPRGVGATLINPLLSGFDGRNIISGSSPLIGKEGDLTFDNRISLYDDPLTKHASMSRPFDDEGIVSRKVWLIQNGMVGQPLFDLYTASQAGVRSTGSAHRDLSSVPRPGPSVLHLAKGTDDDSSLFDGVKEGLVVEGLLGAGQGNELGGDFRANVSLGYKVENGEIVGRVKDTMISGNVYNLLNSVEAIGSSTEWVFGSLKLPSVRCRGVEVAAS